MRQAGVYSTRVLEGDRWLTPRLVLWILTVCCQAPVPRDVYADTNLASPFSQISETSAVSCASATLQNLICLDNSVDVCQHWAFVGLL